MKLRKKKPSLEWYWLKEDDSDICWDRMRLRTDTPVRLAHYGHIIAYYRRHGRTYSLWYPDYDDGVVFKDWVSGGEWHHQQAHENEVFAWRYIIRKHDRRKFRPGGHWGGDPFFRSLKRREKRYQERERRAQKKIRSLQGKLF